jgi:hypothetical protein
MGDEKLRLCGNDACDESGGPRSGNPHRRERTMTDLKKGAQRGSGQTGGVSHPRDGENEENRGAEFGAADRATRGTDRDLDRSGESMNQGHGHPNADRKADGA